MKSTLAEEALRWDAAVAFASYAANLSYEDIPPAMVGLAKQCILDSLGVTIAASTLAPEAREVSSLVRELGGKPESTLLGFGDKVSAPWAAFANGSAGHMLDYDDLGGGHPSVTVVPVACALAERLGGVSGKELITAFTIGIDIISRLHEAVSRSHGYDEWSITAGWGRTQFLGYFSAAATAGRLLGLTEEQILNALGIAFQQVSGSHQMAEEGESTHMRGMAGGFCSHGGLLAALLAQRGITGAKRSVGGRHGLFKLYLNVEPDQETLVGGLGRSYDLVLRMHGFKAWPACGATHSPVDAILGLRREHNLRPEDVEEVVLVGGGPHTQLLSEPPEAKRRPDTSIDGKYSIPFTAAVAVVRGNVTLRDYTPQGLNDSQVLAMAQRVRHDPIPEMAEQKKPPPPTVQIKTRDGQVYSRQAFKPLGRSDNPMTVEQLEAKFRDCASFSAKPISRDSIEEAVELVRGLERVEDVSRVIGLLS